MCVSCACLIVFVSESVTSHRLEAKNHSTERYSGVALVCSVSRTRVCVCVRARFLRNVYVEAVADELSVPTVGMFTRRPLLFKQPAAFSLATGAAAASPTATVEQEYGGRRRSSQEVRAAARRPLSKTLASRSECVSGSKHLVCVSSMCALDVRDCFHVCRYVWLLSVGFHQCQRVACFSVCVCVCAHLCEL